MSESTEPFFPGVTELLVASCSLKGNRIHSNPKWDAVMGTESNMWSMLNPEDQVFSAEYVRDAASGFMVSNRVFLIQRAETDEPIAILLNFLPVYLPGPNDIPGVAAVNVVGEVLAEPTSWAVGQTQRRRMEMIGRMAMGVAHNLNNMLSAILGHVELLKATIPPDSVNRKYMRTIEQASLDGAALVHKIQQYVRQEKHARFERLDLNTLIEDCVSLTKPYWFNEPRRKGISIDVRTELAPVPPVMGSGTELREVFVNLLLNAVQAMPAGGEITIQASVNRDKKVLVSLTDTGTGMPESVRSRIFEPLFTTKGEQGTGMGLAVSYGIIKEHEGSIDVESTPGNGTTFRISFPPVRQTRLEEEEKEVGASEIQARILIVDDEIMVRSVLAKLLSLKGHQVYQASSGKEALDLVREHPFDLIFTDLGMPEMSGRELAPMLRHIRPELRIVLLTGYTELDDHGPGIDLVLNKPFQLDQLEEAIRRLLAP